MNPDEGIQDRVSWCDEKKNYSTLFFERGGGTDVQKRQIQTDMLKHLGIEEGDQLKGLG